MRSCALADSPPQTAAACAGLRPTRVRDRPCPPPPASPPRTQPVTAQSLRPSRQRSPPLPPPTRRRSLLGSAEDLDRLSREDRHGAVDQAHLATPLPPSPHPRPPAGRHSGLGSTVSPLIVRPSLFAWGDGGILAPSLAAVSGSDAPGSGDWIAERAQAVGLGAGRVCRARDRAGPPATAPAVVCW
jgi:hypothetical protein